MAEREKTTPPERIALWEREYRRVNGAEPPMVVYTRGWYRFERGSLWRADEMDAATERLRARPSSPAQKEKAE